MAAKRNGLLYLWSEEILQQYTSSTFGTRVELLMLKFVPAMNRNLPKIING